MTLNGSGKSLVSGPRKSQNRVRRAVFALPIFAFPMFAAFAQSSDKFDAAFRELKRNDNLQFELPVPPPVVPKEKKETPDWLQSLMETMDTFFSFLGPFLELIFYGMLALIVGVILYYIIREVIAVRLPDKKKDSEKTVETIPLYAPDVNEARVLLESVDALAAAGRYQEAVHTLLFRSIQDIDLNRPNSIRRSLTSREIAGLDILAPEARAAFGLISKVVENSFFGGQPIGADDFKKCRAAYEQFAIPKVWAA